MTNDTPKFDLSLGLDCAGDLAAETVVSEQEASDDGYGMPPVEAPAHAVALDDGLPSRERIVRLFARMPSCRDILLKAIAACENVISAGALDDLIAGWQQHNRSVFTPVDLCNLLHRAGAIDMVDEDGLPMGEPGEGDGRTVSDETSAEAGETVALPCEMGPEKESKQVKPAEPRVVFWRATDAGIEAVRADNPAGRIQALLDGDMEHLPVYKCILRLAAREGGVKTPALGAAVNGHESLRSPRLFATHFIDLLEKGGAIEWTGSWTATDAGIVALDGLLGVEDIEVPEDVDSAVAPEPDYSWMPLES